MQDKVLAVILVIVLLGSLGALGYVLATPEEGDTFTEFYLLGPQGEAANYPDELKVGEAGKVMVGIINHEGREVGYRVEVVIGGVKSNEVGPFVLLDEQKWAGEVGFVPERDGENQKVEFLLYQDEQAEAYLRLQLWVNVSN